MQPIPEEEFFEMFDVIPTVKGSGKNPPTWEYQGERVKANTKSEARAYFKSKFGQLPSGADIRKVA